MGFPADFSNNNNYFAILELFIVFVLCVLCILRSNIREYQKMSLRILTTFDMEIRDKCFAVSVIKEDKPKIIIIEIVYLYLYPCHFSFSLIFANGISNDSVAGRSYMYTDH